MVNNFIFKQFINHAWGTYIYLVHIKKELKNDK